MNSKNLPWYFDPYGLQDSPNGEPAWSQYYRCERLFIGYQMDINDLRDGYLLSEQDPSFETSFA